MLIGYARVSTDEQKLDMQIDELVAAGVERGQIYCDKLSGATANRPELEHALKALRPGDTLVVWRLDRLGRSMKDLLALVDRIEKSGAGFRSIKESAMDTTTPLGRFLFGIFSSLAEFERNLTRERTIAGLRAARARGRCGGRPRKMDDRKRRTAIQLITKTDMPADEIAQQLGVSTTTLYRAIPGGRTAVLQRRGELDPKKLLADAGLLETA